MLQTNLKDGKEPVWNETYTLPVHVKEHQALTAIMYDSVRAPPRLFARQNSSPDGEPLAPLYVACQILNARKPLPSGSQPFM